MRLVQFSSVARMTTGAILAASMAFCAVAPAQAAAKVKGDAAHGKVLFNQCKICHSLDAGKNMIGPSLKGVIGRKAAAEAGFTYSPAMKKSGVTWTAKELSDFLAAPMKKMSGTRMAFAGLPKEQDRADLIAYLGQN